MENKNLSYLLCLSFFVLFLSVDDVVSEQLSPVKASLKFSVEEVTPGETFFVGVDFAIDKPWHIYWRYPGEAGLPTKISVFPPKEYEVGETVWPVPIKFIQPGGITGYGYEENTFMWVPVTVPENTALKETVPIKIVASWLACADLCVPGATTLKGSVSIANVTEPDHQDFFEAWLKRLPVNSGEEQAPFNIDITGNLDSKTRRGRFTITVTWKGAAEPLRFLPALEKGMRLRNTGWQHSANEAELMFDLSLLSDYKGKADKLYSLLSFGDEKDPEAVSFVIPLKGK